ncbi:MAG: GNAT family N-acetyltransferase [Myxococcota bacterium]
MDPIELSEYERRVVLRNLVADDCQALIDLQLRCFPDMKPWTRAQFDSHLEHFPEGQFGVFIDERLVASSSSLVVRYDDYAELHDWLAVSAQGTISNHDPDGDTLYGIEIQVDPEFRGMRLARRLYDRRKQLCREKNLARIVIGGRIPGYSKVQGEMTAREYVEAVQSGRLYDPVLTTQLANGFLLRRLIPDYLASDEDSAGYATELEWPNLDHHGPRHQSRRAVRVVRVASVQWQMRAVASFDDFARQCRFFVDTAADYKADFVVFPELFTSSLLTLVDSARPGEAARSLAQFTPQYLELFSDLAIKYNVNIIGGSQFTIEGDRLFNRAYLFRRDGSLEQQDKIHITPSEARWWGVQGGDATTVFDTDRGRIAIVVCYDVEFPELVRMAANAGATILFVPYNTNDRYGHMRVRISAQARCVENHLYAVTAGCVGNLPMVENADVHYAQSGVYTPLDVGFAWDGIAAEASPNIETVLVHELDTETLRRHRHSGSTRNWLDRRRDLYTVAWRGGKDPREV